MGHLALVLHIMTMQNKEGGKPVKPQKILMCGGDMRSIYMADFFRRQGIDVELCATDNEIAEKYSFKITELFEGIPKADVAVFGLPAVKNDMNINCPLGDECVSFEKALKKADKKTVFAGGRFSDSACIMAADYGIRLIDYSTDEVFQIENAFYTAEGAVETIIKNTVKALGELRILITGYGRISKALSKIMSSLGSDITVYARKAEQRAWADMLGYNTADSLKELEKYDVLVNTVPHELFTETELGTVKKDALIIDLSARPGYVNRELCDRCKVRLVFLPGLPALSAPRSAGEAAARAVIRMCSEL